MATVTISQLPVALAVGGSEYVPISAPNGDGTYTTKRVSLSAIAKFAITQIIPVVPVVLRGPVLGGATLTGGLGGFTNLSGAVQSGTVITAKIAASSPKPPIFAFGLLGAAS